MSGPADPRRLVDAVEAADRALVDEDLITENDAEVKAIDPVELLRGPAGEGTPRGGRQRPLPKLADPAAPLLVVENLKTYFDLGSGQVRAVDGVSFTVRDGEALGIAGESGCGKTTTALSLVRLLPSNGRIVEGSVKLFGIDLATKSENALRRYRWREISIVFQGAMNALNPVRGIRDQIAEPLEERLWMLRGRPGSAPASCWSWSGSRGLAGAPTRTSCRVACDSAR